MKSLFLVAVFSGLALASKPDVSAPPQKMAAPAQKGETKPAPRTDKRLLRLDLKK